MQATKKKLEGVKKQQAAAYKGVNEVTTRKQNVAASIERAEAAVEIGKAESLLLCGCGPL